MTERPAAADGAADPASKKPAGAVDVLIFDVDDTMYKVSSGFSEHRNSIVIDFMVDRLGFPTHEAARELRGEYFKIYHSSIKGLAVASAEGRLPKPFVKEELANFWADNCDFTKYLQPVPSFQAALASLRDEVGLTLVAFSNSPRRYVVRCLEAMGVRDYFPDDRVFAVEDVLPACKPEAEAFRRVLDAVGSTPDRAVMFEDSMRNVRICRSLGIRTVLIYEGAAEAAVSPAAGASDHGEQTAGHGSEAALLDDQPLPDDTAVDAVLQHIGQMATVLPDLWQRRFPGRPRT